MTTKDRVKGNISIETKFDTLSKLSLYDESCKMVLKNVRVLAVILKYAISEYKDYNVEDIIKFIDAESISETTEVSPDRTNLKTEMNTEFSSVSEKLIRFDLLFRARNPKLSTKDCLVDLHLDIEPQKKYKPGYSLYKRGMYYLARELSSQLNSITNETGYDSLEKVYSIWICYDGVPRDMQNTVSFYKMENYKNVGTAKDDSEGQYDLCELIMIRLAGASNVSKTDNLLRFVAATLYANRSIVNEFITVNSTELESIGKVVSEMTGVGESIYKTGREEGREEAMEKIAKDLLGLLADEVIAEKTGLSLEKIRVLSNEVERDR